MNSGLFRNVLKAATAGISIEMALVDRCDEPIHEPVVIEVRRGGSNGVAGSCQARRLGYIGEGSSPSIGEPPVRILWPGLGDRGQLGAVSEKEIDTAVIVV